MQIILGKYSGFCFGVKRAVTEAEKLKGEGNYLLGEIIHNEEVNQKLKKQGLITVASLEEVPNGATLLIRTHGEAKHIFEKAKEKNINVIDCTCPFVKDIHKIVSKHYQEGYKIIIIGDKSHPEVQGINGWCDYTADIYNDKFDISTYGGDKVCIVVQTTFSIEKFNEILKNIEKSLLKTVVIFKTICYTTIKRQAEAEELAKKCDAVIVLGGKNSNNTNKLFDICSKHCKAVFRAFSPSELDYKNLTKFSKLGIVLGASTPDSQSQEVIHNMENVTEVNTAVNQEEVTAANEEIVTQKVETSVSELETMEAAMSIFDNKTKFRKGQVITATISKVENDGLSVYIPNTKKEILLAKEELLSETLADYDAKVGDDIEVMIIGLNPVVLSEKAVLRVKEEEKEIEEIKAGKEFSITVKSTNKGGLIGELGSYQVFIPSSQIRIGFVKDLEKYVGKSLRLKAEKVESGSRKQIVASQRVILEAEKAARDAIRAEKEEVFFNSIEAGDIVKGTTQRFAEFGAFVQINGFDCLAHISDLSWTGCKKCSDVLELNKEYEFKILKVDKETKKVSIGYKQLQPKPWELVAEKYSVGDVINGKVVRIVSFGAFVEVEKGIDGLVHVSQISHEWLENPTSVLKVGQEVEAKILSIEPEKEKMNLSIKAMLPEPETKKVVKEEEEKSEKPAKKGKKAKEEVSDDTLREWNDDNGGASIAEILANSDK